MRLEPAWRDLYRCECPVRARAVATSIASMQFDVRLLGDDGRDINDGWPENVTFIVRVPESDWDQLAAVLDEIIAEQEDFDDFLRDRDDRVGRAQRRFIVAMVILLAALAAGGAIEL
ncbi:MAG: hypothetical protein ACYTGG_00840 [Planctomycetota bacterium]|jgi:hypothetical protein